MAEHTYYPICDQCVRAEGDECHTPGCALFLHDAPDHPIHEEHGAVLARTHQDAAREALDGLMSAAEALHALATTQSARRDWETVFNAAEHYRDAHYPEETP